MSALLTFAKRINVLDLIASRRGEKKHPSKNERSIQHIDLSPPPLFSCRKKEKRLMKLTKTK